MIRKQSHNVWKGITLAFLVAATAVTAQAEPPAAPKTSTFAPVKPILAQIEDHMEQIAKGLEDPSDYSKLDQARVGKNSNMLIVLLMGLGTHDEENALGKAAAAIIPDAKKLATSGEDYAVAKAAFDKVQAAIASPKPAEAKMKWEKHFSLGQVMKQVTTINGRLRRNVRRESSFSRTASDAAGQAAVLALVGQATMHDTHEVKDEAMLDQWYKYASAMRDTAGAASLAALKEDFAGASAAVEKLQQTCKDCHEAFRIDE